MPDPRFIPPVAGLLQGRVIAVTGASDGIGRAVAIAAAQHGAQVILIGRSARKLEAVRNAIVADQQGVYLYAAAGSKVYEYAIDPQTGALSPLPGSPVAIGANAGTLTIDPTNRFLYVGSGSAKTLTGYALNAMTGELAPLAGSPFAVGATADVVKAF